MYNTKKTVIALSVVAVLLAIVAAAVWLLPFAEDGEGDDYSYGVSEGLQLVRQANGSLVVEDSTGNVAFPIPLRGCTIDSRFHNGILRFREKATGREGYIDRSGIVSFFQGNDSPHLAENGDGNDNASFNSQSATTQRLPDAGGNNNAPLQSQGAKASTRIEPTDLRSMARSNPFYGEAAKILQGKLDENDAKRRKVILNYCEHFRTAYTTKDIDFLRQVFSDRALIIVGNVVRNAPANAGGTEDVGADRRVTYALHTKADYLSRLSKVFSANKRIDVRFSDFRIMRHPTHDGIYGVTLRQHYKSDRYEDDGWLFLLWDFTNPSMPLIHVRTWQPAKTVGSKDDVISISDFNLE